MKKLYLLLLFSLALPLHAASADLQLFLDQPALNQLTIHGRVINYGPDVATNVAVLVEVPQGMTIGGTNCDTSQTPARCIVAANIAVGQPAGFNVELNAPRDQTATYRVVLRAVSDLPDPDPTFDSREIVLSVKPVADLNVQVGPPRAHIDPGATQRFVFTVQNYQYTVPPHDLRADFTATNGTIERIEAQSQVSCTIDTPTTATCRADQLNSFCDCLGELAVTVRASADRNGGTAKVTAHVSSDLEEVYTGNDQQDAVLETYRWFVVDTTADAGAGSLREAITRVNAECGATPCKIAFEIPGPVPSPGWFTLTPETPLPPITADRVALSGVTQTEFTGDTNAVGPEIAIDGSHAHRGLEMHSRCESVVEGLALGNFDANQALWITQERPCEYQAQSIDRRSVYNNVIGTDPANAHAWPNLRGIRADGAAGPLIESNVIANSTYSGVWMWHGAAAFTHNSIRDNGASGIFLGPGANADVFNNSILRNAQMGVAAARANTLVDIRENTMVDNGGLGIDFGLDGVDPVDGDDSHAPSNAPVLLSATYRDGMTYVNYRLHSANLGPYFNQFHIDVYANDGPDGDGEHWLLSDYVREDGVVAIIGDYRGKWLNATSTRVHFYASRPPDVTGGRAPSSHSFAGGDATTSELSNSVLVQ